MFDIRIIEVQQDGATFTIQLPERAIRALSTIGDFGTDALTKAVAKCISETEAKKHGNGIDDLVTAGQKCKTALARLTDARSVLEGRKVAVTPDKGA